MHFGMSEDMIPAQTLCAFPMLRETYIGARQLTTNLTWKGGNTLENQAAVVRIARRG